MTTTYHACHESEAEINDDVNIPSTSTGNTVLQQNNLITHKTYKYICNTSQQFKMKKS